MLLVEEDDPTVLEVGCTCASYEKVERGNKVKLRAILKE